jgi:hypothetical protein
MFVVIRALFFKNGTASCHSISGSEPEADKVTKTRVAEMAAQQRAVR